MRTSRILAALILVGTATGGLLQGLGVTSAFTPFELALFTLSGACLWFGGDERASAAGWRGPGFWCALAVTVGAAMMLIIQISAAPGHSPGTVGAAIGFLLYGTTAAAMQIVPRRATPLQFLLVLLLWGATLSLLARTYGTKPEDTFLFVYLFGVPESVLFIALGFGGILQRPHDGIWGVISSRYSGGAMIRRLLPLVILAGMVVGWFRLQGQLRGIYNATFAFALFAATNVIVFLIFVWISARIVNRSDAKRQAAFESLRAGNLELRRLNDALQSEIEGHKSTEAARSEVERQLFQSQKMEAIGTLASGIAHDFNNILTVILLNSETVRETLPPEHEAHQNLHEIRKAGSRAVDLIRQIMTFGRKTQGHKEPVRVEDVISEAVEMLRHTLPANVNLTTHVAPDTPQVLADATQMHQVLLNLGTNAAHAMAERGGELEMRVERAEVSAHRARFSPELREGVYARIRVSDTGHGMNEETLKRIFDPFFTTKPPGKGTGLGLSVVHGIMRQHQGSVTVYSEPGKGTVFHLYFPTAEVSAAAEEAPRPIPSGTGQRVLCIDDNPSLLAAVARSLENLGYAVTACNDPAEAVGNFGALPQAFDLVLTDLAMPGLSGLDVARAVRAARPDIPVVLMSGYLRPEDARAAQEAGVRHIVLKPDLLDELGEVIHRVLGENAAQRGTPAPKNTP